MLRFLTEVLEAILETFSDFVLALRETIRRGRLALLIFQILAFSFAILEFVRISRGDSGLVRRVYNFFVHSVQESIGIGVLLALAGSAFVVIFTLRYLRTDFDSRGTEFRNREREGEVHDLWRRVNRLEHASSGLTDDVRASLVAEIRNRAVGEMAGEFDRRLREVYSSMDVTKRASQVRSAAERMLDRLRAEIRALVKRGNLNLGLGMAVTGVGAWLLIYIALTVKPSGEAWYSYAPSYLLRLSAVVFTEIFAFFFLGLYRANLTEIKYFQNEMTNLEAKCLALEFAILSSDQKTANKIADQLAQTERNFVLKKDQTTVELERARVDSQHLREFASVVKELVPSLRENKKQKES